MKQRISYQLIQLVIKNICFSFLIAIVLIHTAQAQTNKSFFRNIGTEEGLSHNQVNCIMQDKRGFIWIGTEDGLNRYDGSYFTVFKNKPSDTTCISGNIITDLHEDSDGIIWIATADGGLTRYNYRLPSLKQFKQFKYNARHAHGITENNINKIAEDRNGNLWLATSNSYVLRFNKQNEKFETPIKRGVKNILSLTMADHDTLWVGRESGGILKINTRTLQYKTDPVISSSLKQPHDEVSSIFRDSNRKIWLGSKDKTLYYYNPVTHTEQAYRSTAQNPDLPNDEIESFAEDKQHNIWIGCKNNGVIVYDRAEHKFISYRNDHTIEGSLVNNHVNTVFIDRGGIVWVGTDNGLSIHNPIYSPFKQYFLPKKDRDINIYDFYKDDEAKLWIATSEGIFIKHPGTGNFDYKKVVYNGQKLAVTKFFVDTDKTFYIGTDYTLFKYNPQTNQVSLLVNTASDPVMKRLFNSKIVSITKSIIDKHPVLIVSPYGHYITYYDFTDKKWITKADSAKSIITKLNIKDNLVRKFYKDKRGKLWLATNNFGLGDWRMNRSPIKYFINDLYNNSSISSNDVYDIQEDKKGSLWVSTYGGGLNYFDTDSDKFSHIKESSNLTEGLQSDLHGNLWMICNGHLHTYNPHTKTYSCYDPPSLKKNGGIKGYIYKDNSDNQYAGGVNFYVSFNPASISKLRNDPSVYFTDFKIFDSSYSHLLENKTIVLSHDQNYFSLEFSAPEYSNNHIHYDYILEGIDKGWVNAGKHNFASYSNLPAGKYLFKARASNWEGSTVDKFSSIIIVIRPPFWQRWWFYVFVITIIVLPCYLIYRYRVSEYIKRHAIRNCIAQDLHDHIGSTLSSISIYSKVAEIYQEQQNNDKLKDLLQTIGETANDTISEMSDIVWTVNPKNDHVDSIVQKIKSYIQPLCAAKNINLNFRCDENALKLALEMSVRKNFFLILKESLNNAIKHSGCRNLTVDIRLNNYYFIEFQVEDDGIGFDPHLKYTEVSNSLSGNGLINIKSRAGELNAKLKIESEIFKGTKVNLGFSLL